MKSCAKEVRTKEVIPLRGSGRLTRRDQLNAVQRCPLGELFFILSDIIFFYEKRSLYRFRRN